MIDLTPACDATAALVADLCDDELALSTPCDPAAWEGGTEAGVALPNATWGRAALTEVVVHGWDLAQASGRALRFPDATLLATLEHVVAFVPAAPVPALWGDPRTLPDTAPLLDRVVAATGRVSA